MDLDPDNPVVKRCIDGMQAESEGRNEDARARFEEAWAASADDFEACVAAHYLARHQTSERDTLRWNLVSLERARAVDDDRVRPFYPSLYLNMGRSHEGLGERDEARRYYELAAARLDDVPAGPYGDVVRHGVAAALARVG